MNDLVKITIFARHIARRFSADDATFTRRRNGARRVRAGAPRIVHRAAAAARAAPVRVRHARAKW
jgi:hypothetical protein